jgi:hypothetical protein
VRVTQAGFGIGKEYGQGLGGPVLVAKALSQVDAGGVAHIAGGPGRGFERHAEGALRLREAVFPHVHPAPGQPQRGGGPGSGDRLGEQGKVADAFDLHPFRVAVPGMEDVHADGAHGKARLQDGIADAFMDGIAEAQAPAVGNQPDLGAGGFAAVGSGRTHAEGVGAGWVEVLQVGFQPGARRFRQFVVGVQPQDPFAPGQAEGVVAGGGEILPPFEIMDLGSQGGGQRARSVPASGIHHHALERGAARESREGSEQGGKGLFLVLGDHRHGQHGSHGVTVSP